MTQRRNSIRRSRSLKNAVTRRLNHQTLDKRELLAAEIISGPRLVSVEAGSESQIRLEGTSEQNQLVTAPRELTFRFDGDTAIDASTLGGIRIIGSGGDGSFDDGNELLIQPGVLDFADDEVGDRVVVARFAEALPDDRYRIQIAGYDDFNNQDVFANADGADTNITALRNLAGEAILPADQVGSSTPTLDIDFEVEVGPTVVAVVPQPVSGTANNREQATDEIHVYFNDDPFSNPDAGTITNAAVPEAGQTTSSLSVVDPRFYSLFLTQDTVENTDDVLFNPVTIIYDPVANLAILRFADDLSVLTGQADGVGTFRLRVGAGDGLPGDTEVLNVAEEGSTVLDEGGAAVAVGSNNTFDGGTITVSDASGTQSLNPEVTFDPADGVQSVVLRGGSIENTGAYVPPWPGAYDAPGSRDQTRDASVVGRIDTTTGINIFPYNFANRYGLDPNGNPLDNAISEAQKERTREIFDLYEQHLGVTFVETEDSGLQIVTGDLRAIQETADTGAGEGTPYSLYRVNDRDPSLGILILEADEGWYDGYGLSPDERPSWFVEGLRGIGSLLGIGDLFELPDGVAAGGSSPDEPNSETDSNDGSLSNGGTSGLAGFPSLPSEPDFLSQSDITIGQALHRPESSDVDFYSFTIDSPTGTAADEIVGRVTLETFAQRLDDVSLLDTLVQLYRKSPGDNGVVNFELVARNDDSFGDDSYVRVDLTAGEYVVGISSTGNDSYDGEQDGTGADGLSEGDYELRITFDVTSGESSADALADRRGTRLDGDADGVAGGDFNFWFQTAPDTDPGNTSVPRTIFVVKDSDGNDSNSGSLDSPYRTIQKAIEESKAGDIIRLLPSAGNDGDIQTVADNPAYELGRGGAGNTVLIDGETFEVKKNVTVMIDAGSIFKLRDSKIVVGSSAVDADRSLAAIQILGTPDSSVVFTSYNDESFGIDSNSNNTTPISGDWAGIELRNDIDNAEGRGNWEDQGIFLDFVSHADMRYGGGRTGIRDEVVSPIKMFESRPTLIHNQISLSAFAAFSADPNSFREDSFHAPRYQPVEMFTSDYDRAGPEIYGNVLTDNSINGLFVRVLTPAVDELETLTVSGRFDDTDIVHVISEVLTISGAPGGPTLLEDRPDVGSVTLTASTATETTLAGNPGLASGTYQYKLTFVTDEGHESLASLSTSTRILSGASNSIVLNNLPLAGEGFSGRNLYRRVEVGGVESYELVAQLDRRTRQFVDYGQDLKREANIEVKPVASGIVVERFTSADLQPGEVLPTGILQRDRGYDYRITFADVFGGETEASGTTNTVVALQDGLIRLTNLPVAPDEFIGTNVYRIDPATGKYYLVAELRLGETSLIDTGISPDAEFDGSLLGRELGANANGGTKLLPRFDARLTIDPDTIVKFDASRIEVGIGADFYAEGTDSKPIIFTSRNDDEYGIGGTFDTNNNGSSEGDNGDWGGIMFRQGSTGSIAYADIRYGGGATGADSFNALEILQADVRVVNSTFINNASGIGNNSGPTDIRGGQGFNDSSTIFIRGSQPVLIGNTIVDGEGAAISINPDALAFQGTIDSGRSTGGIDRFDVRPDNQGPLLLDNQLSGNAINGMRVRSEIVTTDSVWDDTDIVHVVEGPIYSLTHHYHGALRLRSDADQSLVVKFSDEGTLIGGGRELDIDDRIGGTIQVLGSPGFPVVLTSLNDNTIGSGFTPDGQSSADTLGNSDEAPAAGDWIGLQIQSYANDRNVAYVFESERGEAGAITTNQAPADAQIVGDLAADEYSGDENKRLGITVHGTLATDKDVDTYRFTAPGQTTVYFDIDETTFGLDTVVELVNVNGETIARSNDSYSESIDPTQLYVNESLLQGVSPDEVRALPTALTSGNVESANPLDAGFRVVLPGDAGVDTNYYIRVRSNNAETSGQYELGIRLRGSDEVAGSTIQGADIRYATTAIQVSGSPIHSPLTGDFGEEITYVDPTPDDRNSGDETTVESVGDRLQANLGDAQDLGNLLTTDRASLVVTGEIGNLTTTDLDLRLEDVDIYEVQLFAQQLSPDTYDSENRFVTATFDIDYADELARVNTVLSVYDSQGRVILVSRDSNVTDDQGTPLQGVDLENLSAGSAGVQDAYIGPVQLPEGTYYVVVSSQAAVPAVLDQFFSQNATNPDVRLMPINSIRNISHDSLEEFDSFTDRQLDYTAERPVIETLFNATSPVEYTLDDIRLFVNYEGGVTGGTSSTLASFNPFTGTMERLIGSFGPGSGDLAIRDDGELFTYSTSNNPTNSTTIGNYLNVDPADGSGGNTGDDSITFRQTTVTGLLTEVDGGAQFIVNAMTFERNNSASPVNTSAVNANETFWVIGSRDSAGRGGEVPIELRTNILYLAASNNGEILSRGSRLVTADRNFGATEYLTSYGPASDEVEFGIVDTGFIDDTSGDGGNITGVAAVNNTVNANGDLVGVTDLGGIHVFNPNSGTDAPTDFFEDGYNSVIPTDFYGYIEADPAHIGGSTQTIVDPNDSTQFITVPVFSGLSYGPQVVEDGVYAETLFATTPDGWMYAFTLETSETGELTTAPANIFYNGRSALEFSFVGGASVGQSPSGLAFSNLEANPWHSTVDRRADSGHGLFSTYDQTRLDTTGGNSLYFGFEVTGNEDDNTIARADDDVLGQIAPGGSHGSTISDSIDLREYSADDKPTLYFTYHIEVEADDDYTLARAQNDSFRVFAAGDDGEWKLLATNDAFRSLPNSDEYDEQVDTNIDVQTVFDDNADGQWRQVRADLSEFAGSRDVRIRFDFSTAGSMQSHFGSIELVGVDGETIEDNSRTTLQNDDGSFSLLQTIVGRDVVLPSGTDLINGDSFTVTYNDPASDANPLIQTVVFVDTLTPGGPAADVIEVVIDPNATRIEVARAVAAAVPGQMRPRVDGDGNLSLLAASEVSIGSTLKGGQANPIDFAGTFTVLNVPTGDTAAAGSSTLNGEQVFIQYPDFTFDFLRYVRTVNLTGDPNEIIADSGDSKAEIATRILAALPAGTAYLDGDNNVVFIEEGVEIFVQAAPSQVVTSINAEADVRARIDVQSGAALNDDELVVIDYVDGGGVNRQFAIAFDDGDGVPPALLASFDASEVVSYTDSDNVTVIANEVFTAINSNPDAGPFLDPIQEGNTIRVRVVDTNGNDLANIDSDQRTNQFSSRDIAAVEIELPSTAAGITNGELIAVTINGVTTDVRFNDSSGTSSLGSVVYDGPAQGSGDTAVGEIARRFAELALPAGVNYGITGNRVTLYGDTVSVRIDSAGSAFTSTTRSAIEITVPSGDELNDRDTIQLDAVLDSNGQPIAVGTEFTLRERRTNTSSVVNAANSFAFDSTDTAEEIRDKLVSRYSPFATATDGSLNRLMVVATDLATTVPESSVELQMEEVAVINIPDGSELRTGEQLELVGGGETVLVTFVREGIDLADDPANPTVEVIFNENETGAEIATRIAEELQQSNPDLNVIELFNGTGIGLAVFGSSASVITNPEITIEGELEVDTYVIPVTLPAGDDIVDGEQITIYRKNDPTNDFGEVYTFTTTGTGAANEIVYAVDDTAAEVATKFVAALDKSLVPLIVGAGGREVRLVNASSVELQDPDSLIVSWEAEEDTVSNFFYTARAVPVLVDSTMDSIEVTDQLRRTLRFSLGTNAAQLYEYESTATLENYKKSAEDRIRVYNTFVFEAGPYGVNQIAIDESMPGDEFGLGAPTAFASSQISTAGAQNNVVEGVYIDDIVVGFAERGEVVLYENYTAEPANSNFVLDPAYIPDSRGDSVQPEHADEILVGPYALEIRTADEYGVPQDYDPINLELDEGFGLGRSFDTNDRLATGAVTIVAPEGIDLKDGDFFILDDGTQQLTFEFDSRYAPGVDIVAGNVPVYFDPANTAAEVAASIRDAINSDQSQDTLTILASTGDSRESGISTSRRVELFGGEVFVNPGSGRTISLDMVAEETYAGRYTNSRVAVVDHDADTVDYVLYTDQLAQAAVPGYVSGDTLIANGKIGDPVAFGINPGSNADDGSILLTDPTFDMDVVRVYLTAGEAIDIDVDTTGLFRTGVGLQFPFVAVVEKGTVFSNSSLNFAFAQDASGSAAVSNFSEPTIAVGETQEGANLTFTPQRTGYYDIVVSSAARYSGNLGPISETDVQFGDYQMTVRPADDLGEDFRDVLMVDYHYGITDVNRVQDQGQLIIQGNFIRDSANVGISSVVDPNVPLTARLLRDSNTQGLIPGAVITNNVISNSGSIGIEIGGGDFSENQIGTANIFSRVVNNTIVNQGSGIGIEVSGRAAPTLLNNVIVGFDQGIDADTAESSLTVADGNAFSGNTVNSSLPLGSASVDIPTTTELFSGSDFIPLAGSGLIDNSYTSLVDRESFYDTVKEPVGISRSPILAPDFDIYGQRRVDSLTGVPNGGTGSNPFIDRGAIENADFRRPDAVLNNPFDAPDETAAGAPTDITFSGDTDPQQSYIRLVDSTQFTEYFEVQLIDEAGTGLDSSTITEDTVLLTENGNQLVPGRDYTFGYSENSRTIRLTPLAGVWNQDSVYEITLNNQVRRVVEISDGGSIADGDQVIISDASGRETVFEFDSGYTLGVPLSETLVITDVVNGFNDTDTFTITSRDGLTTHTFEIDTNNATASANVAIPLTGAGTIAGVRDAILRVLSPRLFGDLTSVDYGAELGLAPVSIGSDSIQLGTLPTVFADTDPPVIELPGHVVDLSDISAGLNKIGSSNSVTDGDQFTYTRGGEAITFEFDSDDSIAATDQTGLFRRVEFNRTDTPDQVAAAIATALRQSSLGLNDARAIGDGLVSVGGLEGDTIELIGSDLTLTGAPGVTPFLSISVSDTATGTRVHDSVVTITVGDRTEGFRFTTDSSLAFAENSVEVDPEFEADEVAEALNAAIQLVFGADLPATLEDQTISLNETPADQVGDLVTVDVSASPFLSQAGLSGGAIAVGFVPSQALSATSVAASLQTAITDSSLDVEVFAPGGGVLLITDTTNIELITNGGLTTTGTEILPAVSDLAGNPVNPTRSNDETRFTIIMPEVGFDFGDAPSTFGTLLVSPTPSLLPTDLGFIQGNGARHAVIGGSSNSRLGFVIDTEGNGQPFTNGLADDTQQTFSFTETSADISVDSSVASSQTLTIDATPDFGERITLQLGTSTVVYELVDPNQNPSANTVAVLINADFTPAEVAEALLNAIQSTLSELGGGFEAGLDSEATIRLTALDDEDGVSIVEFRADPSDDPSFFFGRYADNGAVLDNSQAGSVLGYVNPLDPAGTNFQVYVTGGGLVDAWIDFNRNGRFDEDGTEQILRNVPVVDGINTLSIAQPGFDVADGNTWLRIRLSDAGNTSPTGVAIGGEVEDYQITVLNIQTPTPTAADFVAVEDTPLRIDTTTNASNPPLEINEKVLIDPATVADQLLPVRFFPQLPLLNVDPAETSFPNDDVLTYKTPHGILEINLTEGDDLSGSFLYTSDPDFFGLDSFQYRLSTQQNAESAGQNSDNLATVTISVLPENDAPGATTTGIVGFEATADEGDGTLVINATDLVASATPDFNLGQASAPQNESNQTIFVRAISTSSGSIVAGGPTTTLTTNQGGTISVVFDNDVDPMWITQVIYTPAANFNSDTGALGDLLLDEFSFTLIDNGISILPADLTAKLVELNEPVDPADDDSRPLRLDALSQSPYFIDDDGSGGLLQDQFMHPAVDGPETTVAEATATAVIRVVPRNDAPVLGVDYVGLTDATGNVNDDFLAFYPDPATRPVPTEDNTFVFSSDFLLGNDAAGPVDAIDETTPRSTNDGDLRVVAVAMDDSSAETLGRGTISLNRQTGMITFTPAPDVYGPVTFTYTVTDSGINESTNIDPADVSNSTVRGGQISTPKSTTITSTIFVEPVNDAPVAYDRLRQAVEDATLTIDVETMLNASLTTSSNIVATSNGVTVPDGSELRDGEVLILTATNGRQGTIEFNTSGVASNGTDFVIQYSTEETAAQLAVRVQEAIRSLGFGGSIDGAIVGRVNFVNTTAVSDVAGQGTVQVNVFSQVFTVPAGLELNDGERLVVTDASGSEFVYEFTSTGNVEDGVTPLLFSLTDSASQTAALLAAALYQDGFGAEASDTFAGQVDVTDISDVVVNNVASQIQYDLSTLILPATTDLINGETVTLTNGTGLDATTIVVEFNTTGTPSFGTDLVVAYAQSTETSSLLASLLTQLRAVGIGARLSGGGVQFGDLQDVDSAFAPSGLTTGADELLVPSGTGLIDGQRILVETSAGDQFIIEFNTTGLVPDDADAVVGFTAGSSAVNVATELRNQLRQLGLGVIADISALDVPAGLARVSLQTLNVAKVGELSAAPGDFDVQLGSPYNEDIQTADLGITSVTVNGQTLDLTDPSTASLVSAELYLTGGTEEERVELRRDEAAANAAIANNEAVLISDIGGVYRFVIGDPVLIAEGTSEERTQRFFETIQYTPPAVIDAGLTLLPEESLTFHITDNGATEITPGTRGQDALTSELPATLTIQVGTGKAAPVINPDTPTLSSTGPTTINVLDNDVDVDGVIQRDTVFITTLPEFGSVTVNEDGSIVYEPFTNFPGRDEFGYKVLYGRGIESEEGLVTISPNNAPVVVNDSTLAYRNESIIVSVLANDSDADGIDVSSVQIESGPSFGDVTPLADGTIRYTPTAGYTGSDQFTYSVADVNGRRSGVATVNIQVVISSLQNPDNKHDVNDDGEVSAIDALLIINHLNRYSGIISGGGTPTSEENLIADSTDPKPNYYDVSGDREIAALDVLQVINELNRRDTSGSVSEPLSAPQTPVATSLNASSEPLAVVASAEPTSSPQSSDDLWAGVGEPTAFGEVSKVVSGATTEVDEDVLDRLAASLQAAGTDADSDASADHSSAIDVAMSRLL
ncbi:tandem-95 repeat protein [Neorhodopirellula lusitana]|uniref:tandem-95 repeat protein n=1 Tax=Neorhodopirellula lusitana TaxID=445327 RepID=UPI00384BB348